MILNNYIHSRLCSSIGLFAGPFARESCLDNPPNNWSCLSFRRSLMDALTLVSNYSYSIESFDEHTPSIKIMRLSLLSQLPTSRLIISAIASFFMFYAANSLIIILRSLSTTSCLVMFYKQSPRLSPNFFM